MQLLTTLVKFTIVILVPAFVVYNFPSFAGTTGKDSMQHANYNKVVAYKIGQTLFYPDFEITYLKPGATSSEQFNFIYYDFNVTSSKVNLQTTLFTNNTDELVKIDEDSMFMIAGVKYYEGLSKPANKIKIKWSSGTGDIQETSFKVGDKTFYLDLAPRKNGKFLNNAAQQLIIHDEDEYKRYNRNN